MNGEVVGITQGTFSDKGEIGGGQLNKAVNIRKIDYYKYLK